jgi:hypothetical protein
MNSSARRSHLRIQSRRSKSPATVCEQVTARRQPLASSPWIFLARAAKSDLPRWTVLKSGNLPLAWAPPPRLLFLRDAITMSCAPFLSCSVSLLGEAPGRGADLRRWIRRAVWTVPVCKAALPWSARQTSRRETHMRCNHQRRDRAINGSTVHAREIAPSLLPKCQPCIHTSVSRDCQPD